MIIKQIIYLFTYLLILIIYLFTYLFVYLLTYLLTYLPTFLFSIFFFSNIFRLACCMEIIRFCESNEKSYKKMCKKYQEYCGSNPSNVELPVWNVFVTICDDSLRFCLKLAMKYLQSSDPLRLLCSYIFCDSLVLLRQDKEKARSFAESIMLSASTHRQLMDEASLSILHR